VYVFLSCLFIKRSCTTPQENQHTFRASSQSTERLARLVFVCGRKRTGEVKEFRRSHAMPFVSLLPRRKVSKSDLTSFSQTHHERDNRSQNAPHFHPHDIQSQVSFRRQPAIPFAHVFPAITVRWSGEREREGHGDQFFAGSEDEAFLYTSLRDLRPEGI
jgi:hypothetical protein